MKRISSRTVVRVAVALLWLALATTPTLKAEFECRQELWAGTWVHHGELWILEREGVDIFPPPGPFSEVGMFVFDEQGRASVARQTNSTPLGSNQRDAIPTFDTQVTINPDCTGTTVQSLRRDLPPEHPLIAQFGFQPGDTVFEGALVCADGQRECWTTFTKPERVFFGVLKVKRIDSFDQNLEGMEALDRIGRLERKIDAVMLRLGVSPTRFQ